MSDWRINTYANRTFSLFKTFIYYNFHALLFMHYMLHFFYYHRDILKTLSINIQHYPIFDTSKISQQPVP